MKAIILATGKGTGLMEIAGMLPKDLVNTLGKPILRYQIDAFIASGINPKDIKKVVGKVARTDIAEDVILSREAVGL